MYASYLFPRDNITKVFICCAFVLGFGADFSAALTQKTMKKSEKFYGNNSKRIII